MKELEKEQATTRSGWDLCPLPSKLWLYANFDCNLRCSYCVTESTPKSPRLALGLDRARHLVDEAVELGFETIFVTGGEPFLLDDICDILGYASARARTTVLTNGLLLKGERLERLGSIANSSLRVQVSLDGGNAPDHEAYRGKGTWQPTVEAIARLKERGIGVCVSTTETPQNKDGQDELARLCRELGIAEEDHLVRPLAKRGFSQEGLEVGTGNLMPEVTVTAGGVYWHPLISPRSDDMKVSDEMFPLAEGVRRIQERLGQQEPGETLRTEFQ